MDNTYWLRQELNKPLFENVVWSRPEQRSLSGKLGIIGGNAHGFSAVSDAFAAANQAGIGAVRLVLPENLSKTIGHMLPESEFAPDNKSGGFGLKALELWLTLANWSDASLLCGDLGKSSETEILLERFLEKNPLPITLTGDTLDLAMTLPLLLLEHKQLLLAPTFSQFQHLLTSIRYPNALTSNMTLYQLVDLMHSLTLNYKFAIIFNYDNQSIIAYKGQVSSTPTPSDISILKAAVYLSVWRLQQPAKPFEAMTSGIYACME